MNKITEVTVTRLFGYEGNDYTVELLPDEPVTFIYGFNGIGKTTFLRLLDAALTRKFMVLDSILFESIQVKFDTDEVLTVRRTVVKKFEEISIGELAASSKDEKGFYFPIVYGWKTADGTELEGKYYFEEGWNNWLSKNAENTKMESGPVKAREFYRRNQNPVKESSTPALQEIENDILRVHVELLHANKDYCRKPVALRPQNTDGSTSIFDIYEELDTVVYPIKEASQIIRYRLDELDMGADLSFNDIPGISVDNIGRNFIFKIPDKIDYLKKRLEECARNDLDRSCAGYVSFAEGCKIFTEVINKRSKLTGKSIGIKSTGDIEIEDRHGGRKFPVDIRNLSSGEKNLLLLYFQLIFELPASWNKNGICLQLLDEPDTSLHPDWLMDFVDNLKYINKELDRGNNFQFVIATQSLAIIYDHNEMMTPMRCTNG